jgi:undecaprenyl diphosphate synthase
VAERRAPKRTRGDSAMGEPKRWGPLDPPVPRERLPRHIAIIMDGNGRWALQQGLPRIRGHEAGVESVRDVVTYTGQIGVPFLTLYAFSTENWKRPRSEVQFLMRLLRHYLQAELPELQANSVRLLSIGRAEGLPADARAALEEARAATASNRGLTLCLALNSGGRDEIVEAARRLCEQAARGELDPQAIDAERLAAGLYSADLPPVDLLIRTAGERRLSNFLLWQACGAAFHVAPACWPEFRRKQLSAALEEHATRPGETTAPE